MSMSRLPWLLLIGIALAGIALGCGGSDDGSSESAAGGATGFEAPNGDTPAAGFDDPADVGGIEEPSDAGGGGGATGADVEAEVEAAVDTPEPAEDAGKKDSNSIGPIETFCGYGSVYGLLCSPDAQTFVDGATVWLEAVGCEAEPVLLQTISDADGYYSLEGIPNGLQTIHVKKGTWERKYLIQVSADKVSDVTASGHKECFQALGPCEAGKQNMNVESQFISGLADIIWFIDTSGSMSDEAESVQANINAFAAFMGNVNIDYRVVLIADGFGLCVPEPLGGPNCTDGPRFRHIHDQVGSNDGLKKLVDNYPKYKDFLREDATTNFIAVTDDNADKLPTWFKGQVLQQTAPGFSEPWFFHSIVGMGPIPLVGCFGAAFGGLAYLTLSEETGGVSFPICDADWSSMFDSLAETVVNNVEATCAYALPNP
ncbi:MAG: hypothetical protein ACI9OJ_004676, partial [Myxococcota bacterium]